jgi:hypothetical protein
MRLRKKLTENPDPMTVTPTHCEVWFKCGPLNQPYVHACLCTCVRACLCMCVCACVFA